MSTVSSNTDNVFSLLNLQSQIEKTNNKKKSRGVLLCIGKDGAVQAKEKGTAFGRFFTIVLRIGGKEAHNLKKCIESISKQVEACKSFTEAELKGNASKLKELVTTLNSMIDKYNNRPKHQHEKITRLNLVFKDSTSSADASKEARTAPASPEKTEVKHTWKKGVSPSGSHDPTSTQKSDVRLGSYSKTKPSKEASFDLPKIVVSSKIQFSVAEEMEKTKEIFKAELGSLFENISDDLGIFKADDASKDTETWRKKVPESIINYFKTRTSDRSIPGLLRERADTLNLYAKDSYTEWNKHLSLLLKAIKSDLGTVRGSAHVSFGSDQSPAASEVKIEKPMATPSSTKLESAAGVKVVISTKEQLKNQLLELKTSEERKDIAKHLDAFVKNWGVTDKYFENHVKKLKLDVSPDEWEKQMNNLLESNSYVKEAIKDCEEVVKDTLDAFSKTRAGKASIFTQLKIDIPTTFTSFKEVKEMVIARLNDCYEKVPSKPDKQLFTKNLSALKNFGAAGKKWVETLEKCINDLQNSN